MKQKLTLLLLAMMVLVIGAMPIGCEDGCAEQDTAVEDMGEAAEEAGDEMGEAAEEATDAMEEAADDTY